MSEAADDLAEALLCIDPLSPVGALRRQRAAVLQHSEGAYRALLLPVDPGGLSLDERAALALRVALIERDDSLAGQFRSLLHDDALRVAAERFPAAGEDRFAVLLRYTDLVATCPGDCGQDDIDRLSALGLWSRDIVALTQLVSFVPYQVRLHAGLRLLQGNAA